MLLLLRTVLALRRPGVPPLRTPLRSVSSGLQPLRGLRVRTDPQFSMVVPLRSQARLWHSLLHWAYFGLFRAQRAAFVRPAVGGPVFRRCAPPSPSAARCSGVADALWACARASSRFAASNGQRPGRECIFTFRTALALRRRGVPCLRTACARASSRFAASNGQRPGRECIFTHSSQSSIHIARKACLWLLLLTGLTSACFAHSARPSCAPQKMPEMTYTPSFLI